MKHTFILLVLAVLLNGCTETQDLGWDKYEADLVETGYPDDLAKACDFDRELLKGRHQTLVISTSCEGQQCELSFTSTNLDSYVEPQKVKYLARFHNDNMEEGDLIWLDAQERVTNLIREEALPIAPADCEDYRAERDEVVRELQRKARLKRIVRDHWVKSLSDAAYRMRYYTNLETFRREVLEKVNIFQHVFPDFDTRVVRHAHFEQYQKYPDFTQLKDGTYDPSLVDELQTTTATTPLEFAILDPKPPSKREQIRRLVDVFVFVIDEAKKNNPEYFTKYSLDDVEGASLAASMSRSAGIDDEQLGLELINFVHGTARAITATKPYNDDPDRIIIELNDVYKALTKMVRRYNVDNVTLVYKRYFGDRLTDEQIKKVKQHALDIDWDPKGIWDVYRNVDFMKFKS